MGLVPRCVDCRGEAGWPAIRPLFDYQNSGRKLIQRLKYHGEFRIASLLAQALFERFRDESFDVLVPVPLHWSRHWWRGFNQSEELARTLAKLYDKPMKLDLKRRRRTPALFDKSREERQTLIQDVFTCRPGAFENQVVAMVDDVLTSGSTLKECTRILKEAGAKSVLAFVPAITLPHDTP
jgi:competence protein ComFC